MGLKGKTLGRRELTVIQAASEGITYPALARQVGVSVKTLQNCAYRAMKKMDVHSMSHAVALCILRGDIPGPLVCDGHERRI